MIAWQNRPQALVCRYIKQCLSQGSVEGPIANGKQQDLENALAENGIRPRTVSESSSAAGAMDQYEDEVSGPAEAAGAKDTHKKTRGRFDSLSTVSSVRFDN